MSIRSQLLIVGLSTLVLPWAGCQYARELEIALRASQEQALLASAGTIANALSAAPQRVFRDGADSPPFDPAAGDIYVFPLDRQPLLDGYREDWGIAQDPVALPGKSSRSARVQAGVTERYLFLYLEIDEAHFKAEPSDVHPARDRFDRVDLLLQRPDGALASYFFATNAPGLIAAQSLVTGEDGTDHAAAEPRIQAYWLQTKSGYRVEARLPLSLIGDRLWIETRSGADNPPPQELRAIEQLQGGRLFFAPRGLDDLLTTFVREGTRATVIDSNGLKFGVAGHLDATTDDSQAALFREAWFRRLMAVDSSTLPQRSTAPDRLEGPPASQALAGHPDAVWLRTGRRDLPLLSAAAPITVDGATRGAVVLEQAGDELVGLRDRALTRLFNLTLLATAVAVAFVFGFATWIGIRIDRLRTAAESAIGNDGHIHLGMPESLRGDEIGALARSFEFLLARLNEHTQYLRTLGGKLSHELRTPLTIVRSSLDNLESEGLNDEQRAFVRRAREGSLRLSSILSALGAAARVEESIKQSERVGFDLRELLISAVGAYQSSFPRVRMALVAPPDACFMRGAPDLIAQLLDKLVENAVDFCPEGGLITVTLTRGSGSYELSVSNEGPPIPEEMLGRLFESLFEQRLSQDDKPHFGLGLYIVRLIAEFHAGSVAAANRADGGGAIFTVNLPVI
ncbi:MAG: ATP-binding protein [Steroidobacteraceae bacterium]